MSFGTWPTIWSSLTTVNAFLKEIIKAQLDEKTIGDKIAVESIEVPEADEQVDKKDGNLLDEDLK